MGHRATGDTPSHAGEAGELPRQARLPAHARAQGPRPRKSAAAGRFVVQEHDATRLHWDLRLERDGVLGLVGDPERDPADAQGEPLAVHVEDHPLDYIDFEGEIPEGNYGAGTVRIWDTGTYEAEKWEPKKIIVTFHGERLQGKYALFQTRSAEGLDDPPHGPAGRPGRGSRCRSGWCRCWPSWAASRPDERPLRVRDQVGRDPRDHLLRAGPLPDREPQPERHHRAVPGAAPPRPPARIARHGPGRRDRGVRRARPARASSAFSSACT